MKRKADFVMQQIGDEILLVPLGAQVMDMNGLITLNDTAAHVWEMLAQERTEDELATAVAVQFDVDATTARADVRIFLNEIAKLGMLIV